MTALGHNPLVAIEIALAGNAVATLEQHCGPTPTHASTPTEVRVVTKDRGHWQCYSQLLLAGHSCDPLQRRGPSEGKLDAASAGVFRRADDVRLLRVDYRGHIRLGLAGAQRGSRSLLRSGVQTGRLQRGLPSCSPRGPEEATQPARCDLLFGGLHEIPLAKVCRRAIVSQILCTVPDTAVALGASVESVSWHGSRG